ncbi:MAG: hypothetical protein GC166_02520 [Alphaproteobacteria bacterium]|nr:hypothetical protein [Alphaproteobacteria bacterium]
MRGISAAMRDTGRRTARTIRAHLMGAVLGLAVLPLVAGCADMDSALFGPDGSDVSTASTSAPGTLPGSDMPAASSSYTSSDSMAGTLPMTTSSSFSVGTGVTVSPVAIESGSDTGTAVNRKIQQVRGDVATLQNDMMASAQQLQNLKAAAASSASSYHEAKAQITTRLQVGTTRGNPELVAQWNTAQAALDQVSGSINGLNAVGRDIANESSRAHFALDTIQATYNVSGAVDEDHRQLSVLEDETNQTVVIIDKLLTEVSGDIQRQTAYVANERANLTTLAGAIKNGELYGGLIGGTVLASNAPANSYAMTGAGTPLVTIKFDRNGVQYQQILYTALSQALQSRPAASFDVVAVSPTRGTAATVQLAQTSARKHAQDVFRSMTDMGVPATRMALSSSTDPGIAASEVRVFVR